MLFGVLVCTPYYFSNLSTIPPHPLLLSVPHLQHPPRHDRRKQPRPSNRPHRARSTRTRSRCRASTRRRTAHGVALEVTDGDGADASGVLALVVGEKLGGRVEADVCALWEC
jgi:hypothetical protein